MLEIKRLNIRSAGTCNFCKRGELTDGGGMLVYPYSEVTCITNANSSGIAISICDDCLDELKART